MTTLEQVRCRSLTALIPPPKMQLSSWIEENVYLPEGVAALPGKIRLSKIQREIADCIGDSAIERVTLVKPVRVGFTTLLTGAIGGYIANDPAGILVFLPTESDCRNYMVSDIEQIFDASPALKSVLSSETDKSGRNTLLSRRFPGGSLKLVAAKSPRNMRAHSARVLFCDEVDAMTATVEGNPVSLAEKRTFSFPDRKIVIGSTPVFEETSHVLSEYAKSDKRIFQVPCPECGSWNEIRWKDIRWPEGEPEKAAYFCPACGCEIHERHKPAMVDSGRWRATAPEVKGHAGFRVNALVSTLANASWGKLAAEFLACKGDPGRLQTFTNTILAEGWRTDTRDIDETALSNGAEPFGLGAIPAEVLAITAGIDVQRDRLECTFVGWAKSGAMFILGHTIAWGDPADDSTWAECDEILRARWQHLLGGRIGIDSAVIDAGDGSTMERVIRFCLPRSSRHIMAGKGYAGEQRPPIVRSKTKTSGGRLWLVGVDTIKTQLMNRLSQSGSIRFSEDLTSEWFEQFASERLTVKYNRGQPVRRFERVPGRRAEALDCVVYAYAARQVLNVNWAERRDRLSGAAVDARSQERPRTIVKSRWLR